MTAHLERSFSHLKEQNQVTVSRIVSKFWIDSFCFQVISCDEFTENSQKLSSDTASDNIPFSILGYLEFDGNRYKIIKIHNAPEVIDPDLTNLLTGRELQIATLIAKGLSNKQVASQLQISEWTVSAHLRRIFIKLKVDNRTAMVYHYNSLITRLH
jgi:DNA-binding CsgD family transcriptional regulator